MPTDELLSDEHLSAWRGRIERGERPTVPRLSAEPRCRYFAQFNPVATGKGSNTFPLALAEG